MAVVVAIMAILTKMVLAIVNLHVVLMPPTKFWLNLTYHMGADEVWRFSRWPQGGHLRYLTRNILAILNFYVAPMPPIKFGLNLHYSLGGDIFWRISRQPVVAILDVGMEQI